jgi:hypothetical protein
MPFELRFKATPDPMKFFDGIQDIKRQLQDSRAVWRQLEPVIGSEMARSVREQGAPIGAPTWEPHSPATIARYGAKQHAMLQNKGKLLRDVYRGGRQSLTKGQMRWGPKKREQFVQQFGSEKRGIPSRQFVGLTEPMNTSAVALMDLHHARIIAAASAKIGGPSS